MKISEIFGEGKYYFVEKKKNGDRIGGKYFEMKIGFGGRRKAEKEKEDNIWRRKIFFCGEEKTETEK